MTFYIVVNEFDHSVEVSDGFKTLKEAEDYMLKTYTLKHFWSNAEILVRKIK